MRRFLCIAAATILCLCLVTTARAGDGKPAPYGAMGAPSAPKVSAVWNRYHDYASATELLKQLAAAHPDRAKLSSLGKSYGGREMWVLTITNFKKGDDASKPAFWLDGGIHANEIQATEACLYTAWYLLECYGENEFITDLVDSRTFYILAMMSPDSRDAHMHRPNSTHSPRTGQRPVDDDRDGLVDEDGPDDLDGDGHITQMRIRDPNGRFRSHKDFPDLMVLAGPDEEGEYRLLGTEGFDNDGDGRINEDGDGYYDPNRNWAWNWQPDYVQGGAGEYPFFGVGRPDGGRFHRRPSQYRGRPVVSQLRRNDPPRAGREGRTSTRRPTSPSSTCWPRRERRFFPTTNTRRSPRTSIRPTAANSTGSTSAAGFSALPTRCLRLRTTSERSPKASSEIAKTSTRSIAICLLGQGLVPWHEVEHPRYGKIEVGGFKKQWQRQPPSFLLEEECHRNMAFVLYHASQLPSIEIGDINVKPLAGNLYEVTAVIRNKTHTPTRTAWDAEHHITRADLATIQGKGIKVLAALTADEPFFRKPQEQTYEPSRLRLEPICKKHPRYARWIVSGKGKATVSVDSVKGGNVKREVTVGEK